MSIDVTLLQYDYNEKYKQSCKLVEKTSFFHKYEYRDKDDNIIGVQYAVDLWPLEFVGFIRDNFSVDYDDNDGGYAGEFRLTFPKFVEYVNCMEKQKPWNDYVTFEKSDSNHVKVVTAADGAVDLEQTYTNTQWAKFTKLLHEIIKQYKATMLK